MNILSLLASTPQVQGDTTAGETVTHAAEQAGGLSALGLNWQSFLFQLITFVIVLLILRQFVFKKLVKTLEDRRQAVEQSLSHAAETEKRLKTTETTIVKMLEDARAQAGDIVDLGHKEAALLVEDAQKKAALRAERLVADAKVQMDAQITKARQELKAETAQLVAKATEHIIKEKLDPKKDAALIAESLKERANG